MHQGHQAINGLRAMLTGQFADFLRHLGPTAWVAGLALLPDGAGRVAGYLFWCVLRDVVVYIHVYHYLPKWHSRSMKAIERKDSPGHIMEEDS